MRALVEWWFEALGRGLSSLAASADPDLPQWLHESEGRRLALMVRGSGRCLEAEVQGGAVRVLPPRRVEEGDDAEALAVMSGADLALVGSIPDFIRFLRDIRREPAPEDPFAGLEAQGDADARREFVELLRRIDPDYEALLARAVGGVAAHAASRTTLGQLELARRSATRVVDDVAEYLGEEARIVPDPAARERFAEGVDALLDKVAELETRLDRARRRD